MRRLMITAAGFIFAITALAAQTNEKPSEAYATGMRNAADAMRMIRAASKEIEDSGAGAQDYEPYTKAAATLKATYATTLEYWKAKKADDAVAQVEKGVKAIAALETAVKETEYRLIIDATTALNDTCTACHTAHRVRLEDGTYEIK